MKAGTAISILAQPGRPDAALYHEHMALGDLAEPLGFDSLFALEHHFTGYSMSPAPLQLTLSMQMLLPGTDRPVGSELVTGLSPA